MYKSQIVQQFAEGVDDFYGERRVPSPEAVEWLRRLAIINRQPRTVRELWKANDGLGKPCERVTYKRREVVEFINPATRATVTLYGVDGLKPVNMFREEFDSVTHPNLRGFKVELDTGYRDGAQAVEKARAEGKPICPLCRTRLNLDNGIATYTDDDLSHFNICGLCNNEIAPRMEKVDGKWVLRPEFEVGKEE